MDASNLISVLKTFVEREADEELDRACRSRARMTRTQAIDVAIAHQREILIAMADQYETDGEEELADDFRDFANVLPVLVSHGLHDTSSDQASSHSAAGKDNLGELENAARQC